MRWSLLLLTGLLVGAIACENPTASTPPPAAVTPESPAATAPAAAPTAAPLPLPATGRRERAGIDLADGDAPLSKKAEGDPAPEAKAEEKAVEKARVPAAEFIVTAPAATVPEVNTGPRGTSAGAALKWVREVWSKAALSEDVDAYTALLYPQFKGRRPEQPGATPPADWGKVREPRPGTPVTWGLEEIIAVPSVTGTLSIHMQEAEGSGSDCRVATRMLTLIPAKPDGTGPWQVMAEERSTPSPCPTITVRDLIGLHSELGAAWKSRDLSAVKRLVHGGFTLRDEGVEAAKYNIAAMTTGAGRWVLDLAAAGRATPQNTRVVGDSAIVTLADGDRLGYQHTGGAWRLTTLWRPKR